MSTERERFEITPADTNRGLVDELLSSEESRAEDAAQRVLDLTQRASKWQDMVNAFKKAHANVKTTEQVSLNFLQWGKGAYRLKVTGAEFFQWEEVEDGLPVLKSCPCLVVQVLDGDTKEVKALVGERLRAAMHWGMARAVLDHIGFADARQVISTINKIIREEPELITQRLSSLLAYVRCDSDGIPLKKDTGKGRRVLTDAATICAG